eukprot:1667625-Rhodomonas_salina.1
MSGRRICAAVLLAFCFCSVSDGTSIIELQSGVPSQGLLGREKQHYYFVNVSQAIGRNIRDPTSIASKRRPPLLVKHTRGPGETGICIETDIRDANAAAGPFALLEHAAMWKLGVFLPSTIRRRWHSRRARQHFARSGRQPMRPRSRDLVHLGRAPRARIASRPGHVLHPDRGAAVV